MKKVIIILVIFLCCFSAVMAQSNAGAKITLSESSIVKDSSGNQYPYYLWTKMVSSGDCIIRPVNPSDANTEFLLIKLTEEQKKKRLENIPKPPESGFFKTGQSLSGFKTTDINGNKINLKELKGKVVVMNFWFIDCQPCRKEMPELNQLVADYKDSSNIVFIGVALDEKKMIIEFLKNNPFDYAIINDGRFITEQYGVKSFPTHLILDREGKVYYHSTGYSLATVYWLRKEIDSLFNKSTQQGP